MNKFAEEGINFTVKSIHGEFEFRIGCDYCPSFNINPQSVNSWEANVEQHMAPQTSCSSNKNTKKANHFSNKQGLIGQSRISSYLVASSSVVNLDDFENSKLASLCLGLPVEKDSIEEDLLTSICKHSVLILPVQ